VAHEITEILTVSDEKLVLIQPEKTKKERQDIFPPFFEIIQLLIDN
jgi:hypothetical protein